MPWVNLIYKYGNSESRGLCGHFMLGTRRKRLIGFVLQGKRLSLLDIIHLNWEERISAGSALFG